MHMTRYEDLPERIQRHLQSITESSGLPPGEDSLARITANWIEKRDLFEEQTGLLDMRDIEELSPDDSRGVLVLTYSGSLLSLGPAGDGSGQTPGGGEQTTGETGERAGGAESAATSRRFEYASIPLRADVPSLVREDDVRLEGSI